MRRQMFLTSRLAAAVGLLCMTMTSALADPSSAVVNAYIATSRAPSYHVSSTNPRTGGSEVDVVNPGKLHMVMSVGESILIGSTMYLKIGGIWRTMDGRGFSTDPDAELRQMRFHPADFTTTDFGVRVVAGVPYHGYLVTDTKTHTTEKVFIDAAGRLARTEQGGLTKTFTKYGEAVSIQPPM